MKLRELLLHWQNQCGWDETPSSEELERRLEGLYSSLGYYAQLMPDFDVPAPADAV